MSKGEGKVKVRSHTFPPLPLASPPADPHAYIPFISLISTLPRSFCAFSCHHIAVLVPYHNPLRPSIVHLLKVTFSERYIPDTHGGGGPTGPQGSTQFGREKEEGMGNDERGAEGVEGVKRGMSTGPSGEGNSGPGLVWSKPMSDVPPGLALSHGRAVRSCPEGLPWESGERSTTQIGLGMGEEEGGEE